MYILDSSAIFKKKHFENMLTIPEVIQEIKDENSRLYLSLINVRVEASKKEMIEKVRKTAVKSGDIHRLSETDIKLIAKGLELKEDAILVTDDYSIQNVAGLLEIQVDSIIQPSIKKIFKWVRVCRGCGRRVENNKEICDICGSETFLKRVDF